jgi:hypothetical protein
MKPEAGLLIALLAAASVAAAPQAPAMSRVAHPPSSPAGYRMEITLERRDTGKWRKVSPQTVFASGDRIRFRYRSTFPGRLYVMNQGSSGEYIRLFPTAETGEDNLIEAHREYMVPAGANGSFRIAGPPGQDIVYWVVMSGAAATAPYRPLPPPPANPKPPANMTPRCDETIWRARGECLDRSAGPRAVTAPNSLPGNIGAVAGATPRELQFIQDRDNAVMSAPAAISGPVVYEFRISHK